MTQSRTVLDTPVYSEAFERLIPKVNDSFERSPHPRSTTKYAEPKHPPDTWAEVNLNENTSYAIFAWEFLRRNRFYQAFIDKRTAAPPIDEWGYQWANHAPFSHGLIESKPYWESYEEGTPPRWKGLDDFLRQLPQKIDFTQREFNATLQPGQIAIVFDAGGLFFGKSPWEIQLSALTDRLKTLAAATFEFKGKHKDTLLRRWCLLKLISDKNRPLNDAAKEYAYTAQYTPRLKKNRPHPAPDFNKRYRPLIKVVPRTTVNDDAAAIYDLVYRLGYLKLLTQETTFETQGELLVPYSIVLEREEMPEQKIITKTYTHKLE